MTHLSRKIILIMALMLFCSCASGAKKNANSLTDSRDGKKYKTVKIGNYIWMAENLNYDAKDSKCYGDKPENCKQYGRLYSWNTAKTACPSGWHLPTDEDFNFLIGATGGNKETGKNIRANKGWKIKGASNGDKFGFSALPAGLHSDKYRGFRAEGYYAYWWAAGDIEKRDFHYTSYIDENYYKFELLSGGILNFNVLDRAVGTWKRQSAPYQSSIYYGSTENDIYVGKDALLSVRCVKD
ncbi:MAG: hypothetical protein LBC75_00770 [Fibromonadaceae bacterium]|nr:hypothetical protein [Fibromonadaceae bacterium]